MEEIKKEFGRQAGVQQEKEKQIKINFGENLRKFWDLTGNHLMEIYGQYGSPECWIQSDLSRYRRRSFRRTYQHAK